MNSREPFCDSTYANQMAAERELSAFIRAVTQLYGSEKAKLSAEDWLEELAASPLPSASPNWRPVTIAASATLANRLTVPQHHSSDTTLRQGFDGSSRRKSAARRAR